jgi:iron complex transport system permease protein
MKKYFSFFLIYILPLPLVIFSLTIGPSDITFQEFYESLSLGWHDELQQDGSRLALVKNVLYDVRVPRVLLTFLIGAGLACSGGTLQAIFRNPLVDPYVLGISSGAAFGAALAIAYNFIPVPYSAFLFGSLSVMLAFSFAFNKGKASIVAVVLSGMIVSGLFTAGLTVVQYMSDPYKLQAIIQWTMGNLHHASWEKLNQAALPIVIGLSGMYIFRWRLNLLALGDEEAKSVGVNPNKDKLILIILATLTTSSSVASAGVISMYGLFIPHIVRMLTGPDNRKAIPANILFGGSFLVMIDNFSRTLFTFEIPIGVFTMLLGGPFFIYLMKRNKINWVS